MKPFFKRFKNGKPPKPRRGREEQNHHGETPLLQGVSQTNSGREHRYDDYQVRTPLRDLLVDGLKTSPVLHARLPKVRSLALTQTLHSIAHYRTSNSTTDGDTNVNTNVHDDSTTLKELGKRIDKEALGIILYNVQTSPYLDKEQFQDAVLNVLVQSLSQSSTLLKPEVTNAMAEKILDGDWEGLLQTLSADADANDADRDITSSNGIQSQSLSTTRSARFPNEEETIEALLCFRDMVVEMLSTSRKIATMEINRRRRLSSMIHSASTTDEIINECLKFLNTSEFFPANSDQRKEIIDLVMNGRFDMLLLPRYFDCEEQPRKRRGINGQVILEDLEEESSDVEDDECVICLDGICKSGLTILPCNHCFCTECIRDWIRSSNNSTCPTCRAPISNQSLINE